MADTRLLSHALATVWDGQLRGACRGLAADLFFRPDGQLGAAHTRRDVKAKAVGRQCPMLDQYHAPATREPHGIRGGLTATKRRLLSGHVSRRHPASLL